jgi:hypothetical protein
LLDEDAQALDDRKAAWAASLLPRGAAEQRIVDDAVQGVIQGVRPSSIQGVRPSSKFIRLILAARQAYFFGSSSES